MKVPPSRWPRISLRARVILTLLASQLLIVGVAIYTMLQNEHRMLEAASKEAFIRYAKSVASTFPPHLRNADITWINNLLLRISQEEDVLFIAVQDDEGNMLGSAGQPHEGESAFLKEGFLEVRARDSIKMTEIKRSLGTFLHEKGHVFHIVAPIKDNGSFLGAVGIAFTTEKWNRTVSSSSWYGLRLIVLAALLGVFGVLVDRRLKRAILKLIHGAEKMADGDLSQKVDISTGDELEKLATSFNKMAENLKISRKKLEEWAEKLERKVAERTEQIEQERQKLDRIVSGIGAGLALINQDLTVTWVNEHYRNKFASGMGNIAGEKCHKIFWENDGPCENCITLRTFKSGKIEKDQKKVAVGMQVNYYSITSAPIHDEKGTVTQVLVLIQDETESKRTEAQLEHASKMAAIGEFAAGVAHEINNPLASVAAYAERLSVLFQRDSGFTKGEREKLISYLERIQDQVYRTKEITSGILDFVRESKEVTELYRLDVNRVVEKVLIILELHIKDQRVSLEKDLTPGLYCIADERQLEQVFLNLIRNCLDAVNEGGEITIKTWQDDHEVFASVRDNGRGMEAEELQKIFNPFYTTKELGKGTGLGLSICYGIMQRFGGGIKVESSVGRGTVFTMNLPSAPRIEGKKL